MRLVFAGTPRFAGVALNGVLDAGHDVALVLTQPDRPAGRGLKPVASEVSQVAASRGLALAQPTRYTVQTFRGASAPVLWQTFLHTSSVSQFGSAFAR